MKSKRLQRLRRYCQVCENQCRDENGFKRHAASESHLHQMLVVGEHAGKHISNFSQEFQSSFVALLSRRFGTKRVRARQPGFQEYISHKHHLHMNPTCWVTLTEFVKHLIRTSVARVDETEKGCLKALAKAEVSMKTERATVFDEQRERMLIAEEIEPAAAEAEERAEKADLSLAAKPTESASSSAMNPLKLAVNPLLMSSRHPVQSEKGSKKRAVPMSVAERLIIEEQERKRRRMDREGLN
ncbi:domain of Kin17 curved DNA-binding protein-domain-containing protein [Lentinula raphanica]|nr:domain of Kin17 curved DNA-binding protein-domain-containing protein [Lentinula raphanica]